MVVNEHNHSTRNCMLWIIEQCEWIAMHNPATIDHPNQPNEFVEHHLSRHLVYFIILLAIILQLNELED